ncbi:hypothetical protein NQ315_015534 [Exocentrus adspersus]|uniref:Tc1-like transposase DDE domain-containing protein n=1 Tax=Exocentrus adspersus TaxID=1586481 RepID=A0AAV8VNV0_9CUCU|nr:hypothetical protein NQ315_015534 [Exocentrus adspersus]
MGTSHFLVPSGRLIIVHGGSDKGFVPNASLIFKAGQASGDYHGQMNYDNFSKWLTEKLLPNIPPNSIVVLDNAPYHSVLEDKVPTKSTTKKDMILWLSKRNITHDPALRKMELYEIVQANKPPEDEKNYKIDRIIRSNGHIPLRTPPYMCELNPIELAWAQVKSYIRSRNTMGDFSIQSLFQVTEEAIASVTQLDWQKFCQHVITIENKFWETDRLMEDRTDEIIISLRTDSDSESDFDYSESDPESNSESTSDCD